MPRHTLKHKNRHHVQHGMLHKQMVGVCSEAGKLDLVLMHRPGRELERLTLENKDELLFDEIPNIEEAQKSHDAFTGILRKKQVTVLYVADLLCETLKGSSAARKMLIDGVIDHGGFSEEASDALTQVLSNLTSTQLAHTVIEGLACTKEELGEGDAASILLQMYSSTNEFLVPPLPNLLFTRDSFSIMEKSVFIWRMAKPARSNEPLIMRVIFTFHTHHAQLSLIGTHVIDWETHADPTATVEGGDVAYLGRDKLLIGNGERTNRAGIEAIERTGLFRQVIAVELPQSRDYMHLDVVLSSIGHHSFILHQLLANQLPVYTVQTPREGDGQTEWLCHGQDIQQALRHLLCDRELDFVDATDEQTSMAEINECRANVLCIGDQHVITYAGDDPLKGIVNQMLHHKQHPCHVEVFPQEGLIEGHGGAHCMTNALRRLLK